MTRIFTASHGYISRRGAIMTTCAAFVITMVFSCGEDERPESQRMTVAARLRYTLVLTANGTVWAAGDNRFGQFGNDAIAEFNSTPVEIMREVRAIAPGHTHSLLLKKDGSLWAMGRNEYGQLGDGTTDDRSYPVRVTDGVRAMAAGMGFSVILKTDRTLWTVGNNSWGQLGHDENTQDSRLRQVMSNVLAMDAGYDHVLVVKTDHSLWGFGANFQGQLGDNSWNIYFLKPTRIPTIGITNIVDVAAGRKYSLFRTADNRVYATGYNGDGALADSTYKTANQPHLVMEGVKAIAAGDEHSLFLTTDNVLYGCGNGVNGQLGRVGPSLDADGKTNIPVQVMTDIVDFDAGLAHTVMIKGDYTLWMSGSNYYGQFGNQTTDDTATPLQVEWGF